MAAAISSGSAARPAGISARSAASSLVLRRPGGCRAVREDLRAPLGGRGPRRDAVDGHAVGGDLGGQQLDRGRRDRRAQDRRHRQVGHRLPHRGRGDHDDAAESAAAAIPATTRRASRQSARPAAGRRRRASPPSSASRIRPGGGPPALRTRTSRAPKRSSTSATKSSAVSGSPRSATTHRTSWPVSSVSSDAVAPQRLLGTSGEDDRSPSRASCAALARPIPAPAAADECGPVALMTPSLGCSRHRASVSLARGARQRWRVPSERDTRDGVEVAGGLDRAAAILDAFDATHRELTLASLVRRCGLPRSTTHRTADRMLRLGWLDKPDDRYRIGQRLFELSGLVPLRHELREAVLPFLQDLHAAVKVAVQLGVLTGRGAGRREDHRAPSDADALAGRRDDPGLLLGAGPGDPRVVARRGGRRPRFPRALAARTPRTLTDPDAVRRELAADPGPRLGGGARGGQHRRQLRRRADVRPARRGGRGAVGHRPVGGGALRTGGPARAARGRGGVPGVLVATVIGRSRSVTDPTERDTTLVLGSGGPDSVTPRTPECSGVGRRRRR